MARSGLFGSRTDRDHDGVNDRTETQEPVVDETVSERHRTYSSNSDRSPVVDRDRDGVDDRDESPTARLDPVAPVSPADRVEPEAR